MVGQKLDINCGLTLLLQTYFGNCLFNTNSCSKHMLLTNSVTFILDLKFYNLTHNLVEYFKPQNIPFVTLCNFHT